MRPAWLAALLLLLCGCGRYSDFTLPSPGSARAGSYLWEVKPEPVLSTGAKGSWDAIDVLNPSVVRRSGRWLNLYSGYDGRTWHTGLAVLSNGSNWHKEGRILSPSSWEGDYIAANGTALDHRGELLYWYQVKRVPSIALARSRDGKTWRKEPHAVLEPGPRGSWDELGVADPYVLAKNGWFYLYYLGQDRSRRQRLGVARSRNGLQWEKLRSNPILELGEYGAFDARGLGEPAVWAAEGSYWMLYTGRDAQENRRIGLARSQDGVHWFRASKLPVLSGDQSWNEKVVCDPSVIVESDRVLVWFGGGDRAEPAENLHGQIGFATGRFRP